MAHFYDGRTLLTNESNLAQWDLENSASDGMADIEAMFDGDGDDNFVQINAAVCFVRGTLINTITGERPIEELKQDDLVLTMDNGYQPIRWIGNRTLDSGELAKNPNLKPIRIRAGALGAGFPAIDLMVSPQHRIMLRSVVAQRMFDSYEILVAAKKLLILDGVEIVDDASSVDYFHLLFDDHQIVFANGSPAESLFNGTEALRSLSLEAREEIAAIFPDFFTEVTSFMPARPILGKGQRVQKLLERLSKNNKPAQESKRSMSRCSVPASGESCLG